MQVVHVRGGPRKRTREGEGAGAFLLGQLEPTSDHLRPDSHAPLAEGPQNHQLSAPLATGQEKALRWMVSGCP